MEPAINFKKEFKTEYPIYRNMLYRCFDERHAAYKNYGGRGITVCERWTGVEGFIHFCQDMGHRPPGQLTSGRALYSLERKNNSLNYELENCYWATWGEQQQNKRPYNKKVTTERNPVIVRLAQEGKTEEELAQQFDLGIPQIQNILEANGIAHQRKPRRTCYTKKRGIKIQALYDKIIEFALANPYSTLAQIEQSTEASSWQVGTALKEASIWKSEWPIGPKRTMWMKRERSARSEFFSGMNVKKDINQ